MEYLMLILWLFTATVCFGGFLFGVIKTAQTDECDGFSQVFGGAFGFALSVALILDLLGVVQ